MTAGTRLDGALPVGAGSGQDEAIAARTRPRAAVERRLSMMKIIVGLVLAAKVVIVAMFVYVLLEVSLVARSGGPALQTTAFTPGMG